MENVDTNAAILVERLTLKDNEIINQHLITSIKSHEPKMMASLAKLITVMLIWDKVIEDKIDPELTLIQMPVNLLKGSSSYYKFYQKGEKIPISILIKSALIVSSNEATFALACWHSGNEQNFVSQMIRKSNLLGLKHSHWTSCSGLERSAYTTAQDMSKLAKVFISQYVILSACCSLKSFEFKGKRILNTNNLMHLHSNIIGLKTGNLVGIGSNLINYWVDDNIHYISIVLGAENRDICYELSEKIMDGCNSFKAVNI